MDEDLTTQPHHSSSYRDTSSHRKSYFKLQCVGKGQFQQPLRPERIIIEDKFKISIFHWSRKSSSSSTIRFYLPKRIPISSFSEKWEKFSRDFPLLFFPPHKKSATLIFLDRFWPWIEAPSGPNKETREFNRSFSFALWKNIVKISYHSYCILLFSYNVSELFYDNNNRLWKIIMRFTALINVCMNIVIIIDRVTIYSPL